MFSQLYSWPFYPIYPTSNYYTNDKVYGYFNEQQKEFLMKQLAAGERTGATRILNDEADGILREQLDNVVEKVYRPKKVIFNPPATIVYWSDGSKTVVKCKKDEIFDREKGLAMAISKKVLGKAYRETFKEAEIR